MDHTCYKRKEPRGKDGSRIDCSRQETVFVLWRNLVRQTFVESFLTICREPKPVNRWVKKFNDTYIYDTETNEWTCPAVHGNIPICSFPLTFVIDQWIFFFGGQKIDEEFITNRLFVFDTSMGSF